jgi:hypothetical protein
VRPPINPATNPNPVYSHTTYIVTIVYGSQSTFRRTMSLPSQRSKNKLSKKQVSTEVGNRDHVFWGTSRLKEPSKEDRSCAFNQISPTRRNGSTSLTDDDVYRHRHGQARLWFPCSVAEYKTNLASDQASRSEQRCAFVGLHTVIY